MDSCHESDSRSESDAARKLILTIVHHYQGNKLENKFFGFCCCKPRVGEPTTVFLSGFKGLIYIAC